MTHLQKMRGHAGAGMLALSLLAAPACAQDGPLGIDRKIFEYDESGIWSRSNTWAIQYAAVASTLGVAVWEGGETRLGGTAYKALDSAIAGTVAAAVIKPAFTRKRPIDTDDPNEFRAGGNNQSFPSGEVTTMTALVTPFILEYQNDTPGVWALAALPVFTGVARMKAHAHWPTDVLGGMALGAGVGYYTHRRPKSFILQALPDGAMVGWKKSW